MSDKLFMTWNINDSYREVVTEFVMGKSKFCCNAPFFFFLEPVAVNARESFYEGSFTVIDMTGCVPMTIRFTI